MRQQEKNNFLQRGQVSVFSKFLLENEMQIILVVFDKHSFQLSSQIVGEIDSYIDANYVRERHKKEYPVRSRRSARMRESAEKAFYEEMLQREVEVKYPFEAAADKKSAESCVPSAASAIYMSKKVSQKQKLKFGEKQAYYYTLVCFTFPNRYVTVRI